MNVFPSDFLAVLPEILIVNYRDTVGLKSGSPGAVNSPGL
jgi:hypothetical protein